MKLQVTIATIPVQSHMGNICKIKHDSPLKDSKHQFLLDGATGESKFITTKKMMKSWTSVFKKLLKLNVPPPCGLEESHTDGVLCQCVLCTNHTAL